MEGVVRSQSTRPATCHMTGTHSSFSAPQVLCAAFAAVLLQPNRSALLRGHVIQAEPPRSPPPAPTPPMPPLPASLLFTTRRRSLSARKAHGAAPLALLAIDSGWGEHTHSAAGSFWAVGEHTSLTPFDPRPEGVRMGNYFVHPSHVAHSIQRADAAEGDGK